MEAWSLMESRDADTNRDAIDAKLSHCAGAARQINDRCRTLYRVGIPVWHKIIEHQQRTTQHYRHRQTTATSINGHHRDQIRQDHEYSRRLLRVVRKGSREPWVGCCTRSKRTLAQRKVPTLPAVRSRASLLQQPALRQRTTRCGLRWYTQISASASCLGGLKSRDIGSDSST